MNRPSRRVFMIALAAAGAALATRVQAQSLVDEKDAQAVALGYVADAKRVDVKKSPSSSLAKTARTASLSGQGHRQGRRMHAVPRQAGGGPGVVQRLGQEGLNTRFGYESPR